MVFQWARRSRLGWGARMPTRSPRLATGRFERCLRVGTIHGGFSKSRSRGGGGRGGCAPAISCGGGGGCGGALESSELRRGIGSIRLNDSLGTGAVVAAFDPALDGLRQTRGLIIDL